MSFNIKKISTFIGEKENCQLLQSHNLKSYTTMRLNSVGHLLEVSDLAVLKDILIFFYQEKIEYRVLGWGANQVIPSNSEIIWLKLTLPFDGSYFEKYRNEYHLPASVRLSLLTKHAVDFNISGWEVFTGIPATFAGAIFMNAGTRLGEIGELIVSVDIMSVQGEVRTVKTNKASFSYRKNHIVEFGEIITGGVIKAGEQKEETSQIIKDYLAKRNATQPLNMFTCGCVFKNPEGDSAGRLIDAGGLKGLVNGGVRVSQKHGNFFENFDNGSIEEFYELANKVRDKIYEQFGIKLDFEVKLNL